VYSVHVHEEGGDMPRPAIKDGKPTNLILDGSTRDYLEQVAAEHALSLAGAVRHIVREHRVFFTQSFMNDVKLTEGQQEAA
jgi:hypothetical protein